MIKIQIKCLFLLVFFILSNNSYSQNGKGSTQPEEVSELFKSEDILQMKLSYSNKNIKKETNDSTYIKTDLSFKAEDGSWKDMEVELRVRGHNRLENCYFPPIKVKIKKTESKGTLFEGNKKLKLVLPCLLNKDKNDYVVKEYMAYKLYEVVSPYHFKTRIVDISFTEKKGKKIKTYELKGILVEDDKKVAKRNGGKVVKRNIHPFNHDPVASVQNALFQFMIANTDYSTYVQHNEKLIFVDGKFIPLPYDFDMCGLVNTSYSVVSVMNDEPLPIADVTERLYRGFKRDPASLKQVREEYIANKDNLLKVVDDCESLFENPKAFSKSKNFISDFNKIMSDDNRYKKEITDKLRTK
jgi:hypothetical protein